MFNFVEHLARPLRPSLLCP